MFDSGGYLPELTTETDRTLLLRAFYVAPEHQGHGYAKAAVGATKAFVQQRFPHIDQVLTVNGRNPGAIRTYLAGGFVDTGEDYLGGVRGPQHILRMSW